MPICPRAPIGSPCNGAKPTIPAVIDPAHYRSSPGQTSTGRSCTSVTRKASCWRRISLMWWPIHPGLPQRLDQSSNSSTYEQSVEFTVDQPGRYALRVEGRAPASLRPDTVPNLPLLNQIRGELRPRLLIQNVDAAFTLAGSSAVPRLCNHRGRAGGSGGCAGRQSHSGGSITGFPADVPCRVTTELVSVGR